jgi:putative ABC transport system permease protein
MLGGFRPDDFALPGVDHGRAVKSVVLSYATWRTRFSGDPAILGRVLHGDDGALSEVVGVLPPSFLFPAAFSGRFVPEVLTALPTPANPERDRARGRIVVARIPPGRSLAELNNRVAAAEAALARRVSPKPGAKGPGPFDTARVVPLDTLMRSYQRSTFMLVFATAVALVLLACLNITGLSSARTQDRVPELTLRRALGGSGADLARLLAAESAVVAVAGGAIGLVGARFLLLLLSEYLPLDIVFLKPPAIDGRVVVFAAIAAAVSVGNTTVWPVRTILVRSATSGFSAGIRVTRARGRVSRFVLIGAEVALALVMAVGGALLAGSLARIWNEDPGFQTDHTLSFEIGQRSDVSHADVDALLGDIRRLPGVVNAGASNTLLLQRAYRGSMFQAPDGATEESDVEGIGVTPGFLETWGLTPVSGRMPTDAELATAAPVVLVSERVARDYWHGQPAVGRELMREGRPYRVIGVVPDIRNQALDHDPDGVVYCALTVTPKPYLASLLVKTGRGDDDDVLGAVTSLVAERHRLFRVRSAGTMTAALGASVRQRTFQTAIFASFGAAAVTIVGVGVLGLVAMVTSRRTREVGVRMALGARPSAIAALIVRQELAAVVAGLAAGGLLSYWTVGFVRSYLYKVDAYDPRIWVVAIAVLVTIATLGAYLPARRASRIDPVKALRVE